MRYDSLVEKVVVITGASSGIGKGAVVQFLDEGARVVLAARNEAAMQAHLEELGMGPDRAIAVKTDVSDASQVQALADKALEAFGRIDVWINNAAVSIYGALEQLNPEEMQQVINVNLLGQMYGSWAAIRIFREQHYGNLINVASVLGRGSTPLQTAYTASKHGIVGFSCALREELMLLPHKDIDVSVILPSTMDTPLFQHARSKLGVEPQGIPPIYDPQMVVDALVHCARNPQFEVVVGGGGKVMVWSSRLVPRLMERVMGRVGLRSQTTDRPKPVDQEDNLFGPLPEIHTGIRGNLGTTREHLIQYPRMHPVRMALTAAVPLVLGYWLLRRRVA